jgi:hypothetical protein
LTRIFKAQPNLGSEELPLGWTAKFWRDRDKCSKVSDVTIPNSNISQCTTHNTFVVSSTLVPTKNTKSLIPILRGRAKILVKEG